MPTLKVLVRIWVIALLMGTSGCYSFGLLRSDLPSRPPAEASKVILRVTPLDGSPVLVRNPWVNQRVVGGLVQSRPWEFPLVDVDLIEEKYYDRWKTRRYVGTAIGITLGLLGWQASGG